jgi:hypothetical protein
MAVSQFQTFFDHCVGTWVTERTYHYLRQQEVERSHTEFVIHPVSSEIKAQVLADNQMSTEQNLASLPGYQLAFQTVSETGERVSQQLNLLFVPRKIEDSMIEGDYLRDRALTHIPQVRSQNAVFLKHEYFSITNQSTRSRSLRHSGRNC